jgi:outer membrane protein assembly factor BamB
MRPRLWPALLVIALAAAWLAYTWTAGDAIRQWRMVRTWSTLAVTAVALTAWLAFFSRFPARVRWTGVAVVGAAALAFAGAFRARGVTGDLVPVLEPRWSRPATPPSPAAAAPALPPAAPAALPSPPSSSGAAPEPAAGEWPQFQGPGRDAVVSELRLAREWSARAPRLVWRQPVGDGWSGFAVSGGVAVTQDQDGGRERVLAFDLATGRPLWAHADDARYETVIAGIGPRATPAVQGGRVFTQGATGILNALDLATGRRLWTRDVVTDNGATLPEWGKSGSPLVAAGRVIVSAGGPGGRSLVAYEGSTGALAWTAGTDGASYSSPVRLTLAGRDQVVILNRASVAGHDAETGQLLWETPFPGGQPNVAVPIPIGPDRLLVSVGYGIGSKAYRVAAGAGGSLQASLLWETPRLKSKFANLVTHGGYVYGLDDGVLTCIDPATGERTWKSGRYGHGQLLLLGGLLLVQSEDGELVLLEPMPQEHRELARFAALDGKTWNPPALAGRLLLVRNDRQAAAYELPVE